MLTLIMLIIAIVLMAIHAFRAAPLPHLGWLGAAVALLAVVINRWPL